MANKRVTFVVQVPIPSNPPGPIDYIWEAKERLRLEGSGYNNTSVGFAATDTTGDLNIPVQDPPDGQEGVAYTSTLIHVSGGVAPYSWAITSGGPTGLALSATTGALTGTPTAAGTYAAFIVTATDSLGATAARTFNVVIAAP